MKSTTTLILLTLMLCTAPRAEEAQHSVTFHPILSLAIKGLHLTYESSLGSGRNAFEVPIYLGYFELRQENPILFTGLGFGWRRYLHLANQGPYLSPKHEAVLVRQFSSGPQPSFYGLINMTSLGMGYKFLWQHFTLDLGIYASYLRTDLVSGGNLSDRNDESETLFPSGSLAFGIPF